MPAESRPLELNPEAHELALISARQAGISPADWINQVVRERAILQPGRPQYWVEFPARFGGYPITSPQIRYSCFVQTDADLMASDPTPLLPSMSAPDIDPPVSFYGSATPTIVLLATFPSKIDHAAILLSAAFAEANVRDFRPSTAKPRRAQDTWYATLVSAGLERSREVRAALLHPWTPTEKAASLWYEAFWTLSDLTPARVELRKLLADDRPRAVTELAKHLDLATEQFKISAQLLSHLEADAVDETRETGRLSRLQADLMGRAGGGLSLSEGAELLGISRQALHKRIRAGTALGMMDGDEIRLPRAQWVDKDGKLTPLPGLSKVLNQFGPSAGWSALQFLLDPDPNLGKPPIEALKDGDAEAAIAAARAYLGADEG